MVRIKVLIVDKDTLFREGVRSVLKVNKALELVGEATHEHETIEKVRKHMPDIVLMNISMPGTDVAEVIRQIREGKSDTKVLLLIQYEDSEHLLSALKTGANGCVPIGATASDLVSAILTVYRGHYFLYPSVAKTLVDDYIQYIRQKDNPDPYDKLTQKEREVLRLVVEGRKSAEIAELLGIAIKTVLGHRTNTMRKLDIHNRTELVKYAINKGIIKSHV